jgi:NAD+ synthase (glutamine-hydrolysing)
MALLERLHRRYGFAGVAHTLATDPGPELADQQVAEHELMPFPVLDACLHLYAAEKMSPDEVEAALATLFPHASRAQAHAWAVRFTRLFTQSIYKWVQSPLALHVGSLDLDRERALQMPVVQKTEWTGGAAPQAEKPRPAAAKPPRNGKVAKFASRKRTR